MNSKSNTFFSINAFKIALIYIFFGVIWILLSDEFVSSLTVDPDRLTTLQNYKGWFFVFISGLLIFTLISQELRKKISIESSLRLSEARLEATFEQAAAGVIQTSIDGEFQKVNRKFCDIVGYSNEELINKKWVDITHPEHLEQDVEHFGLG